MCYDLKLKIRFAKDGLKLFKKTLQTDFPEVYSSKKV